MHRSRRQSQRRRICLHRLALPARPYRRTPLTRAMAHQLCRQRRHRLRQPRRRQNLRPSGVNLLEHRQKRQVPTSDRHRPGQGTDPHSPAVPATHGEQRARRHQELPHLRKSNPFQILKRFHTYDMTKRPRLHNKPWSLSL